MLIQTIKGIVKVNPKTPSKAILGKTRIERKNLAEVITSDDVLKLKA